MKILLFILLLAQGYDRSEWRHWTDQDGDCLDTRHEVLAEESLIEPTIEDCKVVAGLWYDPYTDTYFLDPSQLDVDHFVPLKNAYDSGARLWHNSDKEFYANYLEDPNHLIAVSSAANRSKGSKGPEEWRPPNKKYWCTYARTWVSIKKEWKLTIRYQESLALIEMLCECK